jgi:hypothetical protein
MDGPWSVRSRALCPSIGCGRVLANYPRTPLACVPRPTTPPDASQAGRGPGSTSRLVARFHPGATLPQRVLVARLRVAIARRPSYEDSALTSAMTNTRT